MPEPPLSVSLPSFGGTCSAPYVLFELLSPRVMYDLHGTARRSTPARDAEWVRDEQRRVSRLGACPCSPPAIERAGRDSARSRHGVGPSRPDRSIDRSASDIRLHPQPINAQR